ncbi:hypothetical protein [Photobacterium sp. Hal280]|uniref:hypothetical protein n=1 Tax=Photobacterium sp. Hal280 TaxID=3035163 RepID=UPI00301D25DF
MQKVNLILVFLLMLAGAARAQVYPSTGSVWVTPEVGRSRCPPHGLILPKR